MNTGETSSGRMTDPELEQILAAANAELLEHIEAATDPSLTLSAVMARPPVSYFPGRPSPAGEAAVILAERSLARTIDRARDNAGSIHRALADVLDRNRARDNARTRASNRARAIARAVDRSLAIAYNIASANALYRARADARDLGQTLGHARAIARAVDFALDGQLAENLAAIAQALYPEPDFADLGRGCDRALDLKCALNRHSVLVPRFDAVEVDASGVDLSALDLPDMSVLEGVVWTDETIWPPGVREQVDPLSHEIDAGVYQVQSGGSEREPSRLVTS
jgi:hypothetical protein